LGSYPANKVHHDKCPVNFTTNSCPCTECGHPGEKPKGWNSGDLVMGVTETAAIKKAAEKVAPLKLGYAKVDKPAQSVYAVTTPQPRKKAEGATEKLQALYK
jgi:hypothetical protein